MRVHRLAIGGIGPFAERQEIDFDRLNEAGIFLLAGPTGSGKTSVLDAISIALFGQAPGARRRGRDIVSHHRRPDQVPEVQLEATLGERRIRVTRRPAHTRPKLRGDGVTEESPSVALEVEGPDGEWQPVSSRISEADGQLREWLGMDGDQFAQVVMLPQGEFATFLRADAKDRRRLLEQLFPSHDFAFVERWLRDRAARARAERDERRGEIERCLAAAAAVARGAETGAALGAGGGGDIGSATVGITDGLAAGEAAPDRAETATATLPTDPAGEGGVVEGGEGDDGPGGEDGIAAPALDEPDLVLRWAAELGAGLADAAAKAGDAQTAARQLLELAERRRRAAEDRAARIERCVADERRAGSEWERLGSELGRGPDPETLPDAPDAAAADAARARERALRAEVTELQNFERDGLKRRQELVADDEALQGKMSAIESEKEALLKTRAEAPAQIKELEGRLREAEGAAAGLPGAEQALASLSGRLAAAKRRDGLAPQLAAAERFVQEERDLALAAREHWLHLREARLAGIAAELAATLASGDACPVCGAEEHPRLATATADAPTKDDEEQAEAALAERERAVEDARARCEALRQEHHQLDGQAGGASVADLAEECAAAKGRSERLRERAVQRDRLAAELERLREAEAAAAGRLGDLERELARLQERRVAGERTIAEIDRREDQLRGDDADVPARRRRLAAVAELLHAAAEAASRAVEAAKARVAAEAIELELPLDEAVEAHEEALAEYEQATSAAANAERQREAFQRETADLGELIASYEPLVEAAAVAGELAGLAQGHNPRRLQLSTYVLAARLEQVIEAANLRLAPMSAGRYRLVYSAELAGHGKISGLGIRVLDSHTGLEREASSLSGGESFYASLSLALGLAEVVQREAGGRRLETLFIDEGFGSLDSDTLDQVMSVLDELRDGGRVIGLVSHVEELKTRIPTRIEVHPSPAGSTLTLIGA